jgi:hypothetical protein
LKSRSFYAIPFDFAKFYCPLIVTIALAELSILSRLLFYYFAEKVKQTILLMAFVHFANDVLH